MLRKIKRLRKRAETPQDVLVNFFKVYETVPDQIYHSWLIQKKENYKEGVEFTTDSFMQDALNCFQSLKVEKCVPRGYKENCIEIKQV